MSIGGKGLATEAKRPNKFELIPSVFLVLLGGPTFLVAAYYGWFFSMTMPDFVTKLSQQGPSFSMAKAGLELVAQAAVTWINACIAARCHAVLYERWFKGFPKTGIDLFSRLL
jgi:hypothetical protein